MVGISDLEYREEEEKEDSFNGNHSQHQSTTLQQQEQEQQQQRVNSDDVGTVVGECGKAAAAQTFGAPKPTGGDSQQTSELGEINSSSDNKKDVNRVHGVVVIELLGSCKSCKVPKQRSQI